MRREMSMEGPRNLSQFYRSSLKLLLIKKQGRDILEEGCLAREDLHVVMR